MSKEIRADCDELIGRAGKKEDSLYILDFGPFCEQCYDSNLELMVDDEGHDIIDTFGDL